MKFYRSLGALFAFSIMASLAISTGAGAQVPRNITMTVGVCDPVYPQRCVKPDTNGATPVTMGAVPTGGATAANQTAVQATAGSDASKAVSVQGITGGKILPVYDAQAHTDAGAAVPAGTNLIGKVGIDQTTPGTTNAVAATNFPTTVSTGTGAQGASSPRVTVATDSATVAGSASIPAGTNLIGKAGIDQTTPGTTNNVTVSTNVGTLPLIQATASVPITFTAAGGPTQIIAASGSTKIYVTHIHYVLSGAGTFALVTGTGTNCGTGTTYLEGASGHPLSYAANGGISAGSGLGPIYVTGAGGEICAITTGAVDTSGVISYAQF